jgi:hypothetical protein
VAIVSWEVSFVEDIPPPPSTEPPPPPPPPLAGDFLHGLTFKVGF